VLLLQQSKNPINARTCKHLKSLLGDAYEAARLKLVNPDAAGAGSSGAKKPPSSKSKRKRGEQDEDEEKPRSKKTRQSKPASKADNDGEAAGDESGGETSEGDDGGGSKKKVPQLLLAVKWDEAGHDPTGWWISEKLDGVRCVIFFIGSSPARIDDGLLQNIL
jgi:DNA ligase-1